MAVAMERARHPREWLLIAAFAYFVFIGGTDAGLLTPIRLINSVLGFTLIAVWLRQMLRDTDKTDRIVLAALVLFLVTCVFSKLPRFSFDSAISVVAYAALFGVASRELTEERVRRTFALVAAALGTVFIAAFALTWGQDWIGWIQLYGGFPPLDQTLGNLAIYRFKYEIAILIAMILPFIWGLKKLGLPAYVVLPPLAVGALLVVLSGSRSAWVAAPFSFAAAISRSSRFPRPARIHFAVAIGILAVIGIAAVSGLLAPLLQRAFTTSTVTLRFAIWGDALRQFVDRPFFGSGPGTFPTLITLTGYFQTHPEIGRQPDSALIQLASEAGFAGLVSLTLAGVAFWLAIRNAWNSWSPLALAAVVMFAVTALTNDTVDSSSHVGLAVICAGLAGPGRPSSSIHRLANQRRAKWRPGLIWASAAVVAILVAVFAFAQVEYEGAVTAAGGAPSGGALGGFDTAILLDPSNGLFVRDRGLLLLSRGEDSLAYQDLQNAARLSPADLVAARGAAIAAARLDLADQAMQWASRASHLRPTDPINLVTEAYVAERVARPISATKALVRVLRGTPWLPAAAAWQRHFPTGRALAALLSEAHAASLSDRESVTPERVW
jgi:O-antigen ligase